MSVKLQPAIKAAAAEAVVPAAADPVLPAGDAMPEGRVPAGNAAGTTVCKNLESGIRTRRTGVNIPDSFVKGNPQSGELQLIFRPVDSIPESS